MRKVLFLIPQKNFRDEELREPRAILERSNIEVVIASETSEVAVGMQGMQVKPDMGFSEAFRSHNDFSAVVVVGGSGSLALASNGYVIRIIKEMDRDSKLLAAICLGPVVLARAGVLQGRRATVSHSDLDSDSVRALKASGAVFVENSIVEDGKIITAAGPQQAVDFGKTILTHLTGRR